MFQRAIFVGLVIASVALADVASSESPSRASAAASAEVVRSANLFGRLKACEVPGVHEHLLARGVNTLAYAGEFTLRTRRRGPRAACAFSYTS